MNGFCFVGGYFVCFFKMTGPVLSALRIYSPLKNCDQRP